MWWLAAALAGPVGSVDGALVLDDARSGAAAGPAIEGAVGLDGRVQPELAVRLGWRAGVQLSTALRARMGLAQGPSAFVGAGLEYRRKSEIRTFRRSTSRTTMPISRACSGS